MFGARLATAEGYAALLAGEATERGLIGPREVPRLWDRHILNCAVVTELVAEGATVCDVGSGAGLPGLVMAIRRPDLQITLVEPLLRRTTFLEEVVAQLGLANVAVLRGRAEALHGQQAFDVVTSRAVAGLATLLEWSLPLVSAGGAVVAMKGASVEGELSAAAGVVKRLRASEPEIVTIDHDALSVPTTVVRVEWGASTALPWEAPSRKASKSTRRRTHKRT